MDIPIIHIRMLFFAFSFYLVQFIYLFTGPWEKAEQSTEQTMQLQLNVTRKFFSYLICWEQGMIQSLYM